MTFHPPIQHRLPFFKILTWSVPGGFFALASNLLLYVIGVLPVSPPYVALTSGILAGIFIALAVLLFEPED